MPVQITLLGAPSVTRDGAPVALDTRKALALIAHLALRDRPRSRDALGDLLWPAHDTTHARGALRRTLSTVRSVIGDDRIQAAGDGVALRRGPGLEIDVDRFRLLAAEGASPADLSAAVALFAGGFLEGFAVRDSVEFDDWHSAQADDLNRELSSALRRIVARAVRARRPRAGPPPCPPLAGAGPVARARPPRADPPLRADRRSRRRARAVSRMPADAEPRARGRPRCRRPPTSMSRSTTDA